MIKTNVYVKRLVATGFGIPDGPTQTHTVGLLVRYPDHIQTLPPCKLSNLDALEHLVSNPGDLGPRAFEVLCAKNSKHRNALRHYKGGKVKADVAGAFAALPGWMAVPTIINEIANHIQLYNQRLLLLQGMARYLTETERRAISRKEYKGAVAQLVDLMIAHDALDCRIARYSRQPRDARVRILTTYGDNVEHGDSQGNCVGKHRGLLCEIARGEKVIVEAAVDGAVYTVEVLLEPKRWIGRVEVGKDPVPSHKRDEIAQLVARALKGG